MDKNTMKITVEDLEENSIRALGDGYNEMVTDYLKVILNSIIGEVEKGSDLESSAKFARLRLEAFIVEFKGKKLDLHTAMARAMATSDVLRAINALRLRLRLEIEKLGIAEIEAEMVKDRK